MGTTLTGLTPATTYDALIKVGDNGPITGALKVLSDGLGTNLPMEASTTAINFTGTAQVGGVGIANTTQVAAKQDTLVSGTNIKTINSTSILGSGNIAVVTSPSGVSGAIQFSNGSAFASDASNLFWDDTNNRLGVGTNAPSATGHFRGAGITSATSSLIAQNSAGTTFFQVQDDSAIRVQDGGLMKNFSGTGTYNLDFGRVFIRGGDSSSNGALSIGTTSTAARVVFQGSGSTSATTSLLVQDSTGQETFRVRDNNQIDFRGGQLSWINPAANCWRAVNGGSSPNVVGTHWLQSGNFIINDGTSLSSYNTSVMLGVVSTTKGFLPPVMTTTQKNAISAIAGLVIYDSTTNKLCCYNGSTWNDLF